jgi:DNA-binding NtrC family response regulator
MRQLPEHSLDVTLRTPAQEAGGKPGVLVVDDDAQLRALLARWLEQDGFQVWVASCGDEAIILYREHQQAIAVVLLDVCMPELDGPATLEILRGVNPDVRVDFMSGDPGSYTPEELLRRGALHFFAKPFHLADLGAVLRLQIDGASTGS